MRSHSCLVSGFYTAALAVAQGAVLHVSPGGAIPDVQTAVNMAGNGDLIEVAPGAYPAFAVTARQLSVVGIDPVTNTPAVFTVSGGANTPAIRIDGLTAGELVTVSGARIDHTNATAPAIVIANCPTGSVRLLDVVVTTNNAIGVVPYEGVVEVVNARCAWFDRVRVGDHRVFANGPSGTGVAGVFCADSQLHLNHCDIRGLRSANASVAGGDALRTVGPGATAWLVDSLLLGGMSSAGAVAFTLGGHAIHDFGGQAQLITACDCTLLTAVGTVSTFAVAGASSFLANCPPESIARTELTPFAAAVRIGTSTTVAVSANVGNRGFILVFSAAFDHAQIPGLFTGAFLFRGTATTLAVGVLGGAPTSVPLNVPVVPAAIGLQITLQSAVLDLNGSASSWSMATAAGFTVR